MLNTPIMHRFSDRVTFLCTAIAVIICYIASLASFGITLFWRDEFYFKIADFIKEVREKSPEVAKVLSENFKNLYDTSEIVMLIVTFNLSITGIIFSIMLLSLWKIKGNFE